MKKVVPVTALALSFMCVASSVAPRRAEAIVGLGSGNVPLIAVGGALMAAGLGSATAAFFTDVEIPATLGMFFGGAAGLVVGIVLLDEGHGGLPQFQSLSPEQQAALAVTADEYAVYESELEEIGVAIDSGAAQAVRSKVQSAEQAKSFFDAEYANLSPVTRSVMSKIVQANLRPQIHN